MLPLPPIVHRREVFAILPCVRLLSWCNNVSDALVGLCPPRPPRAGMGGAGVRRAEKRVGAGRFAPARPYRTPCRIEPAPAKVRPISREVTSPHPCGRYYRGVSAPSRKKPHASPTHPGSGGSGGAEPHQGEKRLNAFQLLPLPR
jgi:hypothetical protein